MAEWLYEAGIGEARAILVEGDHILEAQIELPGLRAGTVAEGRLTEILVPGRRGVATLRDGAEVLVEPLPKVTQGAAVRVQIVREAVPEPGALKRAKGRITDAPIGDGPDLATRIGAHHTLATHEPDLFEQAGWSELLEEASTGIITFAGGALRIALTPAMTLIDVDGDDAIAGATAAAKAIRRFGMTGNIGIDLPTVAGKTARQELGHAFDASLPQPFERTAVNGFGFLQVIRPRVRSSIPEVMQYNRAEARARASLRQAQRAGIIGASRLSASCEVIAALEKHKDWTDCLATELGGRVLLVSDPSMTGYSVTISRIG